MLLSQRGWLSSVSSTEKDIDTRLTKAWSAIDRLSIIWKANLTDKMKRSFFQAAVVSILLYGCTTWTLTKRLEKKLDGNYTRMLWAILNRSWQQHPIRRQLYSHLPPITKTIQARRTRHAGHCWRSKDEIVSDVLLWTPAYGQSKAGQPAQTFIQQLCDDTGCNPEDLPKAMNDRETWRERVKDIRASRTWWWWWWFIFKWLTLNKVIHDIYQKSSSWDIAQKPFFTVRDHIWVEDKNCLAPVAFLFWDDSGNDSTPITLSAVERWNMGRCPPGARQCKY